MNNQIKVVETLVTTMHEIQSDITLELFERTTSACNHDARDYRVVTTFHNDDFSQERVFETLLQAFASLYYFNLSEYRDSDAMTDDESEDLTTREIAHIERLLLVKEN